MDTKEVVDYLEAEHDIVMAVSSITKETTARYNDNHQFLDIQKLNGILKASLMLSFGLSKEEIPNFFLNRNVGAVVLSAGNLAVLVKNIVRKFDVVSGSSKKWEWS